MIDESNEKEFNNENLIENQHSEYKPINGKDSIVKHQLTGMYQNWFLDYASYVILERAVPHINDGFKPVQRRILHSMKRLDDGRYNKVANIVGHTMQFHPHGDASIGDALVQLGQKDLLIDCQGNWGNILTGDGAAAPRYIEARLSKFALDVVFNPKTTEWQASYDGRNKEPITLPVKFPLLLAQGVEGIAVGLSSNATVAFIACIMTGFCTSMLWPGTLIMMEEKIPHAGVAAFALMAAGGDLGASVAPQLLGVVVDKVSASNFAVQTASTLGISAEQLGLKAGMLVTALFPLIGTVTVLVIMRRFKKEKSESVR